MQKAGLARGEAAQNPAQAADPPSHSTFSPGRDGVGRALVDIDAWNERGYTARITDLLQSRSFEFLDQDVLNVAADGDFVQLADQWNARKGWDDYSNASIVHFTHAKPNTQECLHPEKATFLEYRRHTPWRKTRLQTRRDRRIRTLMLSVRKKWQRFWAASGFGAPSRVD